MLYAVSGHRKDVSNRPPSYVTKQYATFETYRANRDESSLVAIIAAGGHFVLSGYHRSLLVDTSTINSHSLPVPGRR
jgi:hypothetical protein